jgi:hypothetical protein
MSASAQKPYPMSGNGNKAPAKKFRLGFVNVTVWKNDTHYNTVLSRSYKDGNDYQETNQLGTADLMNAARLLQRAEEWISEQAT